MAEVTLTLNPNTDTDTSTNTNTNTNTNTKPNPHYPPTGGWTEVGSADMERRRLLSGATHTHNTYTHACDLIRPDPISETQKAVDRTKG